MKIIFVPLWWVLINACFSFFALKIKTVIIQHTTNEEGHSKQKQNPQWFTRITEFEKCILAVMATGGVLMVLQAEYFQLGTSSGLANAHLVVVGFLTRNMCHSACCLSALWCCVPVWCYVEGKAEAMCVRCAPLGEECPQKWGLAAEGELCLVQTQLESIAIKWEQAALGRYYTW